MTGASNVTLLYELFIVDFVVAAVVNCCCCRCSESMSMSRVSVFCHCPSQNITTACPTHSGWPTDPAGSTRCPTIQTLPALRMKLQPPFLGNETMNEQQDNFNKTMSFEVKDSV